MRETKKSGVMLIYAGVVIASGLVRFFGQSGGEKGLWFGLAMGGLALAGAVAFWRGKSRLGRVVSAIALLTVGGWFAYESLVIKGLGAAEPRMLIVLGLTIATALVLKLASSGGRGAVR